jgi:hypothetical protein
MNIVETEGAFPIVAKTCGCREEKKGEVTYEFIDSYQFVFLDKKDIIYAELEACERLLKNEVEKRDKNTVESEIRELKIALDLLT